MAVKLTDVTDFVRSYCNEFDITEDYFNEFFVAMPCDCEDDLCLGWQVVTIEQLEYQKKIQERRNRRTKERVA